MKTATISTAKTDVDLVSIMFVAFLGLSVLFAAGFTQGVHDSTHDTRHATGFICH